MREKEKREMREKETDRPMRKGDGQMDGER